MIIDEIEEKLSCLVGDAIAFKLCRRTQHVLCGLREQVKAFIDIELKQSSKHSPPER